MVNATGLYAVLDREGGLWALAETYREARAARVTAEDSLDAALCCGHHLAAGWVRARLPIGVRYVSRDEAALMREEQTPELEREP